MKRIKLTKGQYAAVDDDDYVRFVKYKWRAYYDKDYDRYYAMRSTSKLKGRQKTLYLHREIMGYPEGCVIFLNHDTLDCRRSNLAIVTRKDAAQHRRNQGRRFSKYKGVSWRPRKTKPWRWSIHIDGVHHGGYCDRELEAAHSYNEAVRKYAGDYAHMNDITDATLNDVDDYR